ncbi:MAG: C1 family peptidase [Gammaproteobacteria bacterium]|nr:C1 family peptidase [Gammaproteobacteria bacterium]
MPKSFFKDKVLDARPDRLDLRDREYRPMLRSLPGQWPLESDLDKLLPCYTLSNLVLDQKREGACTGFGLASVINYLIWINAIKQNGKIERLSQLKKERQVSPKMLYNMARLYDEWGGEDYEGSSCRGAMKGWHRHGVATRDAWKDNNERSDQWPSEAVKNPLGAYYRINKDSVVDMQSAILEVGAIYCSASIHDGWWVRRGGQLQNIQQASDIVGAHAFALVGYNGDGFILQNSWGSHWGYKGFAVLTYADWVENGTDAWVAALGVPMKSTSPKTFSNHPLQTAAEKNTQRVKSSIENALHYSYDNIEVRPWSEEEAYQHTLVIANDGRPKRTIVTAEGPDDSARIICYEHIEQWLKETPGAKKIAIYAHGGLNSEQDSINRIRVMAPYFKANGIYPLFVSWKSGLLETIKHQIEDHVNSIFRKAGVERAESRATGIFDVAFEAANRAIEAVARRIIVRGLWSEMKENACDANDRAVRGYPQRGNTRPGGMVILSKALKDLSKKYNIEIHMIGHSAGSILLGHWLNELKKRNMQITSATLLAPACTVEFANRNYVKAHNKNILDKKNLFINMMDDERELADNVGGIYRKSLLYLVSRALEDIHKMPLLGMAAAWDIANADQDDDVFNSVQKREIEKWLEFATGSPSPVKFKLHDKKDAVVQTSRKGSHIDLAHGSFDNDIIVIEQILKRITGSEQLSFPVENLSGF